ncbi:hypothetical protein SDC9_98140 [bioreactor metagenome]|uniref:Uncharacterized protein n=1 Tax=bioreactor metagenome TaxID=1076179 RepID=A0A645ADV4_9ZZZZ
MPDRTAVFKRNIVQRAEFGAQSAAGAAVVGGKLPVPGEPVEQRRHQRGDQGRTRPPAQPKFPPFRPDAFADPRNEFAGLGNFGRNRFVRLPIAHQNVIGGHLHGVAAVERNRFAEQPDGVSGEFTHGGDRIDERARLDLQPPHEIDHEAGRRPGIDRKHDAEHLAGPNRRRNFPAFHEFRN